MSGSGSLELERVLPARPSEVFAAWTTPESMARWMSPRGMAEAEVDLRVGGSFRVIMVEADRLEHTGEYLEVDPPRRLVFTWISPYTGSEPSVVTIQLHPHGDGTRLALIHEQLPTEVVGGHRDGWSGMLERLEEVVRT